MHVHDTQSPVPDAQSLPAVVAQCSAALPSAPTATDACEGSKTGTADLTGPFGQGDYTITWTFTDSHGNHSTQTQAVHVHDTLAPVPNAASLPDVLAQCSAALPAAPTATDACEGSKTGTPDLTGPFGQGDYTITWTFTDSHGNHSTQTQAVHVHDTLAPTTPTIATASGECSVTVTAPTTTDNCAGTVTGSTSDPLTYSSQGTFTVHWVFSDGHGNSATANQTVIVSDATHPSIICPVAVTLGTDNGQSYASGVNLGSPTTGDNCGVAGVSNNAPNHFPIGTTPVTWTVTDIAGNHGTCIQNVTVTNTVTGYKPAGQSCVVNGSLTPGHVIQPPINADGSSVCKQGSTVPAKFCVFDANCNSVGTPGVVTSFSLVQIINGTTAQDVNEVVDSTTPDNQFRWDPSAQQWIFNISTKTLSKNKTYVYLITLNDGSTIQFKFGLK